MDNDDDVTELSELYAEKVSGVSRPANGTPWLVLKASNYDPDAGQQMPPKSNLPKKTKAARAVKPPSPRPWAAGKWPGDPKDRSLAQGYADRLGTGIGDVMPAPTGVDQRAAIQSVRKQIERIAKNAKTPQERVDAQRSLAAAISVEALLKAQYGNRGTVTPSHTARVAANDLNAIPDGGRIDNRFVNNKAKRSKRFKGVAKVGNNGTVTPSYRPGGTLPDVAARIDPSPEPQYKNRKAKAPKGFRQAVRWSDDSNDVEGRMGALKEIDTLGKQLRKAKGRGDPLEIDRLSQQLTLQQLRLRHMYQTPAAIPQQPTTVTKSTDNRIARLQKSHDKITDQLATYMDQMSPTRIAELQQAQRQVSSELLLERLRQAHRAGRI